MTASTSPRRLALCVWTLVFLTSTVVPAIAQNVPRATLSGTVTSAATGAPIPDAHVFIAVSMNGTTTNAEGQYYLENVPLGAHRLYVSVLGYEPQGQDILLREPRDHTYDFTLEEAVIEFDEVVVTAEEDRRWQERLEKFTRLFIGETAYAEDVKITNAPVLDFSQSITEFKAWASEPLVIENRALGYRITYFLKDFEATTTRTRYDGEPLYEELEPSSPQEADLWARNRREAFFGSFRHFMLAALSGRIEEQGFLLYSRPVERDLGNNPRPGNGKFPFEGEILKATEHPGEKMLTFDNFLEVTFTKELESEGYLEWQGRPGKPKYQSSMLLLENGPTLVDAKGDVLDPYGVTFFGYLAYERVANELPKEYRPWQ